MEIVNVVSEKVNDFEDYVRKSNPPPFLVKTYMMVDDGSSDAVISWNADGTAFIVWQPAEFARDVLPTLFKHSNFSSFVRQLNTYGFRKVATSRWEFCNDLFQRDKKHLLCRIRRRKAWAHRPPPAATSPSANNEATTPNTTSEEDRRSSSTSSSSEITNLADENKRLKMENGILTSELSSMKDKCQELIDLVALYSTSTTTATTKEIETKKIEVDEDGERLMLFGVRLDVKGEKRKRSSELNHKVVTFVHSQSCRS